MHMFHDALVSFAERRVIHMDWQEFQDEFPIKLNEQQQEAIRQSMDRYFYWLFQDQERLRFLWQGLAI